MAFSSYSVHCLIKLKAENKDRLSQRKKLRAQGLEISDRLNTWCIMQNLRSMKRIQKNILERGLI